VKALLIEFIGTFFLVLVVALTGNPIAIGAVLIAMVYMGGYISGAHYNPAVTMAMFLSQKISSDTAVRYFIAQFFGAIFAAIVFLLVKGNVFLPSPGSGVDFWTAFLVEALFTFALSSVVLHTGATEKTKGNDYYGLAIGLTVMAGVFAVGPISGAAFNPAVGAVPLLLDMAAPNAHIMGLLLYILGPLTGASLASLIYLQKS
jgi:aquaporin Z